MRFAALFLAAGFFASTVNAGALIGDPFSTTVWNANGNEQVIIRDDGKKDSPFKTLTCTVDLMTGNDQQVKVDTIMKGIKLNADPTIVKYKPKPTMGPPGKFYFVRLTCDPNKVVSFSARFIINGIKGTVTGLDPAAPIKEPAATTPDPTDNTTGGGGNTSSGGGFGTSSQTDSPSASSASSPSGTSAASNASPAAEKGASPLTRVASPALLSAALGFLGLASAYIF